MDPIHASTVYPCIIPKTPCPSPLLSPLKALTKILTAPDWGAKNMGRFINNFLETESILFVGFCFPHGLNGLLTTSFPLGLDGFFLYLYIFDYRKPGWDSHAKKNSGPVALVQTLHKYSNILRSDY
jgi:hypothetical protein